MRPLPERETRTAFANCTKGEAKRLSIPQDSAQRPWDDLDSSAGETPGPGSGLLATHLSAARREAVDGLPPLPDRPPR